ncbi:fungal-specific transcription factor [Plectosphaerella plurivora]|uniref:Fungal-specific transcription factor n=1 Tax=Plectosphaerella plurivora TaxID=936078 RepID=A0A9P8VDX8_9PEZI|nr:fungal-specific transcription factor [Plectosphaerella plurivora]
MAGFHDDDAPSASGADNDSVGGTTPPASASGASRPQPKTKPTACRRCHSRKVKCSGGHPCQNCRQAGKGAECSYPRRNRQVKVAQSYIDGLLDEIQRLKAQSPPALATPGLTVPLSTTTCVASANDPLRTFTATSSRRPSIDSGDAARNVTLDVRPWFVNTNVFDTPILIGEAADAAFATRFRQAISDPAAPQHKHIPRVNYATDRQLMLLADSDVQWPSPSRCRFLIEVALKYLCRSYHVVRRTAVMENLEQSVHNPAWGDSIQRCKFWALFAVGELYSTRSASDKDFPGMAYFAKAARILGNSHERPNVESVEIRLILSFYSLALNRRYSAYALSGTAMRMVIVMGLHLNIPVSQMSDPAVREHRRRVFWTAYIFDRMWASKLGHPPAIQDDDIDVDLPSNPPLDPAVAGDFADAEYYIASLRLAGVITRVIRSIYSRRNQGTTLSTRVQQALKDLRAWVEELPGHLHVDAQGFAESVPKPVPLHLSFNQCAILATRPVLLHVLRSHMSSWPQPVSDSHVPASAITLSETCIRCARHSVRLLTECWIDGSFATFDYFYTQYLFSSLTVLAVSSLLETNESRGDRESFEEAARFLEQLREAGNFAAHEFCHHVNAIKALLVTVHAKRTGGLDTPTYGPSDGMAFAGPIPPLAFPTRTTTAGMALAEPSLQELLAQPALDLKFLEGSVYDDYSQGLYWPDFSAETWTPETWALT